MGHRVHRHRRTSDAENAEQSTAALLRKQRGWRVVNHVNLRQTDIDHVFLGPDGIYAVETKWSAYPCTANRLATAAQQAAGNARDLTLWEPLKRLVPTRALVVLWVPTTADLETPTTVNRVPVIAGTDFAHWWRTRPTRDNRLTESDMDQAVAALSDRCDVMDPGQPTKPPSLIGVASLAAGAIGVGILGLLLAVRALEHLRLVIAGIADAAALLLGLFAWF